MVDKKTRKNENKCAWFLIAKVMSIDIDVMKQDDRYDEKMNRLMCIGELECGREEYIFHIDTQPKSSSILTCENDLRSKCTKIHR